MQLYKPQWEKRKGYVMKKDSENKKMVICTIILVIVIFTGTLIDQYSYVYQWHWVLIPWVRIIFHAVAAISISMILSWIALLWASIAREIMGAWVSIVSYPFPRKRKKIIRFWREGFTAIFRWIQPFLGSMLYIRYSYKWEYYQAEYYKRAVQATQLRVDIIFSIIGGILWIVIYHSMMIDKRYLASPKEAVNEFRELLLACEDEELPERVVRFLQKAIIILTMLVPIWVVLSGMLFSWVILKSMADGLWFLT